jgi:hypothetical protein
MSVAKTRHAPHSPISLLARHDQPLHQSKSRIINITAAVESESVTLIHQPVECAGVNPFKLGLSAGQRSVGLSRLIPYSDAQTMTAHAMPWL